MHIFFVVFFVIVVGMHVRSGIWCYQCNILICNRTKFLPKFTFISLWMLMIFVYWIYFGWPLGIKRKGKRATVIFLQYVNRLGALYLGNKLLKINDAFWMLDMHTSARTANSKQHKHIHTYVYILTNLANETEIL